MNIVIQKFGGTSVATDKSRTFVLDKVIKAKEAGEMPVVVVSAMGRLGDPYATDTMLEFIRDKAGTIADREYDLLLSCGEVISAVMLTTMLQNKGYKAIALTGGQGGIITNNMHKSADLLYGKSDRLISYLEEGIIPVVAGFQGITADGEVTTLGRGGSDTSAAMLGGILNAKRIDIYTDVDGIMTADPRVCEYASIIPAMSYNEIFQMADSGAKVIHPRAVEYAMRANIPLYVKNTFSDAAGTCVIQSVKHIGKDDPHKILAGVAHRMNRIQVKLFQPIDREEGILEAIAKEAISIDLINILPECKLFTINLEDKEKLENLLKTYGYHYELVENCCKVTVIGERMTGVPGVMARIIKALSKHNIKVLQTADSLTTIACLIHESHLTQAVNALHEEFRL